MNRRRQGSGGYRRSFTAFNGLFDYFGEIPHVLAQKMTEIRALWRLDKHASVFRQVNAEEVLARFAVLQPHTQKYAQLFTKIPNRSDLAAALGRQEPQVADQRRKIKVFFRFKVQVQSTFADASFLGYILNRGFGIALSRENRAGGIQNRTSLALTD